ncbi:hypothetical protein LMH87_009399 [Akanthomyces muscarius]|uniref:Azaphilone pigments biosynthesis cluster protein L N-terminal domain-containing protein n=1 Tax=Akanthomyces muscarius TaxID=2231603 RepID=A0A9W8QDX3_AKAMU|nr:hypothetical protein LMH87_009399 [Akanthomyces muscarius]KAJ4152879.1 hypothetical protein LMH87_009399 [Akanthomyces muscarius]
MIQNAGVQSAVRACDSTCADFRRRLGEWPQRSTEDSISWRDHFCIGMFKVAKIQAFRHQVELCKSTIAVALGTANCIMTVSDES